VRGLHNGWLLQWELDMGAERPVDRVESATLTDGVRPWLVSVEDSAVLRGTFETIDVLSPFIGVFGVTDAVLVGERL